MRVPSTTTKVAILKVLDGAPAALGAAQISTALLALGLDLHPRTVRFYLLQMDQAGLTELVSRRRGRRVTDLGREELSRSNVIDKVGIVASRIDHLAFQMTYDPAEGRGTVIMNTAHLSRRDLSRAIAEIQPVFLRGLTMSTKVALASPDSDRPPTRMPDAVALGTVCSITLNGVLLHQGIPIVSRFGALLEIRDWKPARFVELIEYRGSTLDPFEIYIQANMTTVRAAARTGSGIICASLREVPSVAIDRVRGLLRRLKTHGLGGIMAIGDPGQPLYGIPVTDGYTGVIVIGGLNPIAAVHEAGIPVSMKSLARLREYEAFQNLSQLSSYAARTLPAVPRAS